jgi:hypothetical protein
MLRTLGNMQSITSEWALFVFVAQTLHQNCLTHDSKGRELRKQHELEFTQGRKKWEGARTLGEGGKKALTIHCVVYRLNEFQ